MYPVSAFARRRGFSEAEARDIAESFVARMGARGELAPARSAGCGLRTHLLCTFAGFLECSAATPEKNPPLPDAGATPEDAFNQAWAGGMIRRAIDDVRLEHARARGAALTEALGQHAWGGCIARSQADAAAELGMTEHAFAAAVHRLRRRTRERLRELVADTVPGDDAVENEVRFLLAIARR